MKTSKYIKIDQKLPHKKFYHMLIRKQRGPNNLYVLCTPPNGDNLFEIIPCSQLSNRYKDSYILGVSRDKSFLIDYIVYLIDALYNKQILTYEMLKNVPAC